MRRRTRMGGVVLLVSRQSYMILAIPNTGSDWLMDCISRCGDFRPFVKEYFNPRTNPSIEAELAGYFGCELASHSAGIFFNHEACLQAVFERTWLKENYTLDKEVWSFAKIPFFNARFKCVVLLRGFINSFPPKRGEVWQWYDCIAHQLAITGISFMERAEKAFAQAQETLLESAVRLGIPIIQWEDLMRLEVDALATLLRDSLPWPLDHEKLAQTIAETRIPR